jgi:hypothetical protein
MQYIEPDVELPEFPLTGGDVTEGLVRKGATVRRQVGRNSAVTHAVLAHLDTVGFEGSPRFLGIDVQGREVLSFIDGEVAGSPYPEWTSDIERAASVARLLRKLDDAMLLLGLPDDLSQKPDAVPDEPPLIGPMPDFWGHRDITPQNVVFRDGQAHAFIDFDLVKPSTRIDEVCNMLLWWAPLMPKADRDPALAEVNSMKRVTRLVNEYRLDMQSRQLIVPVAQRTAERAWHSMRYAAEQYGGGWKRMWENGYGDRILRRQDWLKENAESLQNAAMIQMG